MGPDAPHRPEAAAPGVRHQAAVVRPLLVSLLVTLTACVASCGRHLVSPGCLCRDVHAVCLWDDKGPAKIHQALKEDILDFIKQAQAVRRPARLFG